MTVTERDAFLNEIVGCICGVHVSVFRRVLHVLRFDFHGGDHFGEYVDGVFHRVACVEDRRFVFLQILVIRKRKSFAYGEKGGHIAVDSAGLSTDELCHIRILLLGHYAAAR